MRALLKLLLLFGVCLAAGSGCRSSSPLPAEAPPSNHSSAAPPDQQPPQPARKPDVPYEPSSAEAIAAMIRLAEPGPNDIVYDLGCGDGRVVIEAVKRTGASGVCVDLDPVRIKEARENAARAGVSGRIRFRTEDLFETDIHDANVVMLFLWPEINLRLLPKLLRELAPGTRIVSNMHDMGDFAPEQVVQTTSPKTQRDRNVYLWRVPPRTGQTGK